MKKYFINPFFILLFLPALLFAQSGKVFDNLTLPSKILKGDRNMQFTCRPVTIHQKNHTLYYTYCMAAADWMQFGNLLAIADMTIYSGRAIPMIIIMPDATTGRKIYFNNIHGEWGYEDFFFKELIPYVEKTYRVKSEKRYRAIAGLSAGGGASFIYALHHPEMFSSSCPISANAGPFTLEKDREVYKRNYPGIADTTIVHYHLQHNVLDLVNSMPMTKKAQCAGI